MKQKSKRILVFFLFLKELKFEDILASFSEVNLLDCSKTFETQFLFMFFFFLKEKAGFDETTTAANSNQI